MLTLSQVLIIQVPSTYTVCSHKLNAHITRVVWLQGLNNNHNNTEKYPRQIVFFNDFMSGFFTFTEFKNYDLL